MSIAEDQIRKQILLKILRIIFEISGSGEWSVQSSARKRVICCIETCPTIYCSMFSTGLLSKCNFVLEDCCMNYICV